jgi:glycosyltransferase involved in cell wall biosynthesis
MQDEPEPVLEPRGRRVVIDALAARFGGTAYASVELAQHLADRSEVAAVSVLARRGAIVQRELAWGSQTRSIELRSPRSLELPRRLAWEAAKLPGLLERERCDVLISMSGVLPRMPRCRVMCLLGNSLMFESRTPANSLRRWAVARTVRASDYVAAPSRPMAALVSAATESQCDVTPLGVDHTTFTPGADGSREILCVADFYAHKRHDLLLEAWRRLSPPRPTLRLIGDPTVDARTYGRVIERVKSLPERLSVEIEHDLPRAAVAAACRRARVFVMPSEHESFCLPLAESMACGVPPVLRDHPTLRDTARRAGAYVVGDDPNDWAAVIAALLNDDRRYHAARVAAIERAAAFSWEALAATFAQRIAAPAGAGSG